MDKTILITGVPGSGKTTLIRRVVSQFSGPAGGFYTQEMREGHKRKGFEIITLDGERGILAHVDIESDVQVSKYGVDLATLDDLAVGAIQTAIDKRGLVVIDEIGPMEIASARFRGVVMEAIASNVDVLATVVKRNIPFTDNIKSRPKVTLIEITKDNRDQLVSVILSMLS